jgi:hypothetical protein
MPVPSQGHYGFHSFPVVDWFVCLYTYEFWLSLCKIVRSSVILLLPLFNVRIMLFCLSTYSFCYLYLFIAYQNKNHTFNWLNTLHVTFTIPRYRLECWYRPVHKPCINWYYWSIHGYLFVYVLINYNVTYNLILFLIISWTPFKQLL